VFEFLVETDASYETPSAAACVEDMSLAADQVTQAGAEVHLVGAIFVPEDDITLYPFESLSADAVREAITRAGLRFDAITEAVSTETNPTPFPEEGHTNDTRRQPGAGQHTHWQSRSQTTRSAEAAHARRPAAEHAGGKSRADRPPLRALVNRPRRAPALHIARAEPLENRGDREHGACRLAAGRIRPGRSGQCSHMTECPSSSRLVNLRSGNHQLNLHAGDRTVTGMNSRVDRLRSPRQSDET
jgi:hypothetical protein